MSPADTLVLFAHPALERAHVGPVMIEAAAALPGVEVRDLYELYPDFTIDVAREQKALAAAHAVILQFPLYWFAPPALMKEWLDLVLTHGFAYGAEGRALEGKTMACAVTTGGRAFAFDEKGQSHDTIADFLRPLEQTARLCRMRWKTPFVVHDAPALDAGGRSQAASNYAAWLARLAKAKA
jgi:glutathione-regulated potassium-efflux system ancillary protein KefG